MIPFLAAVGIYSGTVQFNKSGEIWTAFVKILPIYCLVLFVFLHGWSHFKAQKFPKLIVIGLICSSVGDVLLDFDLFIFGMIAFGVAQGFYIWAFQFKPYFWLLGGLFYAIVVLFYVLLFNNLDEFVVIGFPIYGMLLVTMSWRAIARIWLEDDDTWRITRILCGIGSVLFVVSDGVIAINKFYTPIPQSGLIIMVTYYLAQFTIALSVLSSPKQKSGSEDSLRENVISDDVVFDKVE